MISRFDPVGDSDLLMREMRRLVELRWFAGISVVLAAIAGKSVWPDPRAWIAGIALGVVVLAYNACFWALLGRHFQQRLIPFTLAWFQIVLDLLCLAVATVATGGLHGPILGFFVLHMVLSSMLLSSMQSYLVAGLSTAFVLLGLAIAGQWPHHVEDVVLLVGWVSVLLLTSFLAGRITDDLRDRETVMRGQHEQLRAILDTAVEGIITISHEGVMLSANAAVYDLLTRPVESESDLLAVTRELDVLRQEALHV